MPPYEFGSSVESKSSLYNGLRLDAIDHLLEREPTMTSKNPDIDYRTFLDSIDFRNWLSENVERKEGIWLRIVKKGALEKSVSYAEALDEALCFGWIDASKKPLDETSWLQRFCPRRSKSNWSKINIQHAERLIQDGRMTPKGQQEIDAAKSDGRWANAYDSPKTAEPQEDLLKELAKHPDAEAFFHKLSGANRYAILYRLQTAKRPETRERRMMAIIEMLANGKTFH